jgi:hypothetical protein
MKNASRQKQIKGETHPLRWRFHEIARAGGVGGQATKNDGPPHIAASRNRRPAAGVDARPTRIVAEREETDE